ncbi:hypothetical protein YC2023_102400 [Brassica napus]
MDQYIEPAPHGHQDVLNNSTEVHPSNRTDQTDRAVYRIDPRLSGMEFRLEPRSDDRTDRTRACLSRPSRQSTDNSRARLSLGREEPEDIHGFSPGGPSGQSRKSPYRYRRASIRAILHLLTILSIHLSSRSAIAFSDHIQHPAKVILPDLGRIRIRIRIS